VNTIYVTQQLSNTTVSILKAETLIFFVVMFVLYALEINNDDDTKQCSIFRIAKSCIKTVVTCEIKLF